jgi:hypothetical protein
MFVAALVVPAVFDDDGVLFGVAFVVVCAVHLALYAFAARGNRDLLAAVVRLAPWTLLGATLILVAGFAEGVRTWLWLAALACSYVGAVVSGSTGWQLHASHFAERHGLVVIIALGEAFISIGIGATGIGIGPGEVVAAILGLLVATSFWIAYFDVFSSRGERMLGNLQGAERVAFGRDVFTYTHFPMIVGIVLFAFAMKKIIGHVGDELEPVAAFALCGGSALYLLTYSAIRMRIERRVTVTRGRFVAALACSCSRSRRRSRHSPRWRSSPRSGWGWTRTSSYGAARTAHSRARRSPRPSGSDVPPMRCRAIAGERPLSRQFSTSTTQHAELVLAWTWRHESLPLGGAAGGAESVRTAGTSAGRR